MIRPYSLDKPLAALVAKLPRSIKPLMDFGSFIAAPIPMACILLVYILSSFIRADYDYVHLYVLVVLAAPIAELSKFITRRKRPETLYAEQMRFKTYSFPSGHTYIATLVFGFLTIVFGNLHTFGLIIATLLVLLIFMVGVSRVYLGAHFPSDVIAGWLLGGMILFTVSAVEGVLF